ncbi:MAG: signal recognition particle subunit [Thermococcaceae archaeon]|jgi:signal recognition particle subunit SRP19|uniref:signal recognition particle protein Srp19 n=1 Tax=Thermococcus TaxID=2263 RepID=UPI0005B2989C|nr:MULTISPECIES: signal recognition particle protein Srp19 [Thermococcus]KUJ98537.1 MAG: Signal recognition particle 19 kDa protein [Thermococcales archaeon 44_46]MDK2783326.1 signal recognition particle subunit [Thermococcaceae archaeon]MCA6214540.1 signal recognition particle protein Srp19 [Thermococcus bergensis]MDK2853312.1 signal recognition particle subunit [Thermococcaceae archaeon]MDK2983732.1 signal recognition particle subunit [Thermococcaceae archaeon]
MGKFVIWANEIDARISRKYGREVPKNLAVERPNIDEIIDAAKSLGITVIEVNRDALNPRLAGVDEELRTKGRVIVESKHGKSKTLKLIAQKVREFRKARKKK